MGVGKTDRAKRWKTARGMYLSGGIGVLASRFGSALTGLLSLWMLSVFLDTRSFAGYMLTMSLVYTVGFVSAFGLDRVLILQIGKLPPHETRIIGGRLAVSVVLRALAISVLTMLLVFGAASVWPRSFDEQGVREWYPVLAVIIPGIAVGSIFVALLEANRRVGWAQLFYGCSDLLRCVCIFVSIVVGAGTLGIKFGAVFAVFLPLICLAFWLCRNAEFGGERFSTSEYHKGVSFSAIRVAHLCITHLDILFVGFLAPPEVVAPYVIASRFAWFIELGKNVFAPAFAPRVRRFLELREHAAVVSEYRNSRAMGGVLSSGLAILLLIFGEKLLGVFGADGSAFQVLVLLVGGQLTSVAGGLYTEQLSMTGHLRIAATVHVFALAVFVGLLFVLVPWAGAYGAAISFVIVNLLLTTLGVLYVKTKCGFWPWRAREFAALCVLIASLLLVSLAPGLTIVAIFVVLAIWLSMLWSYRDQFAGLIATFFSLVGREI